MESQEQLQAISALTKIANDASSLGLNLLNINKESIKEASQIDKPQPTRVTVDIVDARVNA
jgi:hypothetical protein